MVQYNHGNASPGWKKLPILLHFLNQNYFLIKVTKGEFCEFIYFHQSLAKIHGASMLG